MIAKRVHEVAPTCRILVSAHVQELVEQNLEKFSILNSTSPVGVCCAGLRKNDVSKRSTFGSIGSLKNQAVNLGHIDLMIIDEAHMISPNQTTMYRALIQTLQKTNPCLRVIGLTATHYRMGSGLLTGEGQLFTDIAYNRCDADSFVRFIEEGFLAPLVPRATNNDLQVEGIKTVGGDFHKGQLDEQVNISDITNRIADEIVHKGQNRRSWLTFCTSIDHANNVAEALEARGVRSVAVHNKLSKKLRRAALSDFKAGRIQHITNKDMLTTGHDFPQLDMINMLRLTKSAALWVQMLGRGTRPSMGKTDCLVLDFAGNTARLGPINDPVMPTRKSRKKGQAPVRVCDSCLAYNHASARICKQCSFEFPFVPSEEKLDDKASAQALVKVTEVPEVQDWHLTKVTYRWHQPKLTDKMKKQGKKRPLPRLVVEYEAGFHTISEEVYLESQKPWARSTAYRWWESHSTGQYPVPKTIDRALYLIEQGALYEPTILKVWTNKKPRPEIMNHAYRAGKTTTIANIAQPTGQTRVNSVLSELRALPGDNGAVHAP